jgi:hypothetical protein
VTRKVFYMAHPVGGDVDGNIKRALRWLAWLRRNNQAVSAEHLVTVVCPWIAGIMSGEDDNDPTQRERGLQDCEATAALLDGIVLVGGRVSSGMDREREAVIGAGGTVVDLTHLGAEPPSGMHGVVQFDLSEGSDA